MSYWEQKARQRLEDQARREHQSTANPAWRSQSIPVSWALANIGEAGKYQRLTDYILSRPWGEKGLSGAYRKEKKKGKPTIEESMTGMVALSDMLQGG